MSTQTVLSQQRSMPANEVEQHATTGTTPPVVAASPAILDRIIAFVKRFVFLRTQSMYLLVALWIIATYLHGEFQYMGYLFIHSPEKGSGKTRLLEVLDKLVYESAGIDCAPTAAVLFRTAKGHTQLLDECDGWVDIGVLKNILNAGFQKDGQTSRCEQERSGAVTVRKWPVYAPRAIAGIGRDILSDTTQDRTFFVEMVRQTKEEQREKIRGRRFVSEAADLKKEIEQWVKTHRAAVAELYESMNEAELPYLKDFRDRTIDVSEPLAVVLEIAYKDNPEMRERARLDFSEAIAAARQEKNNYAPHIKILKDLLAIMEGEELIEQPSVLAERLAVPNGTKPVFIELEISEALRHYGFPQKSHRTDRGPRLCYVIKRAFLKEVLARYAQ